MLDQCLPRRTKTLNRLSNAFVAISLSMTISLHAQQGKAASLISQSNGTYPSITECIDNTKLTVKMFTSTAASIGIVDVKTYTKRTSLAYVSQTFYSERNVRLLTVFVCEADGSSKTTSFTLD
jgi:hypothetical protein